MKSQLFASLGLALAFTITGATSTLAEQANSPADVNNPTNTSVNGVPTDSTIRSNSPTTSGDRMMTPQNSTENTVPMNSNSTSTTSMTTYSSNFELSPLAMEILCRDFPLNSRCPGNNGSDRTASSRYYNNSDTSNNSGNSSDNTYNRSYPYRSETDRRPAVDNSGSNTDRPTLNSPSANPNTRN